MALFSFLSIQNLPDWTALPVKWSKSFPGSSNTFSFILNYRGQSMPIVEIWSLQDVINTSRFTAWTTALAITKIAFYPGMLLTEKGVCYQFTRPFSSTFEKGQLSKDSLSFDFFWHFPESFWLSFGEHKNNFTETFFLGQNNVIEKNNCLSFNPAAKKQQSIVSVLYWMAFPSGSHTKNLSLRFWKKVLAVCPANDK